MLFLILATIKYDNNTHCYYELNHSVFFPPQACDTVHNVNQEVYLQMSQAAAYVLNVSHLTQQGLTDMLPLIVLSYSGTNDDRKSERFPK